MGFEEFMELQEKLTKNGSTIFDYLAGVKIPQKRGRKPGQKKEAISKLNLPVAAPYNYQKPPTPEPVTTPTAPAFTNEDISSSAHQSLQDTLAFFRKRTENKTLEEMAHKFQSKLKTNNQTASEIMNASHIGIISHKIYEYALVEAQKKDVEITENNLRELSGFQLTNQAVQHIMGNLSKDYLIINYPLNKNEYADEKGAPYLIEGTVTVKKDAVFKHLHSAIENKLVKIIKDEIQVLEDLKKEPVIAPTIQPVEKLIGYSIRQNGKVTGAFSNFWRFAENKIKEVKGTSYKLIGKGSSAARGSNHATGVNIHGKEFALEEVGRLITDLVTEFNTRGNGNKVYTSEITERPAKKSKEVKAKHPQIQKINDEIKALKSTEFAYFGSGVKGFETYIYLQESLTSNGYKLIGKVSEENQRTFNILKSITNSDTNRFSDLLVKYRDTTTTNGSADILLFDYNMFKESFAEVQITGFVTHLAKNSIVAFMDNPDLPKAQKETITNYFHKQLQQNNFSANTVSTTDKLIIYHVQKAKNGN